MRTYENMFYLGEGDLRDRHYYGERHAIPSTNVTKAAIISSGTEYIAYSDLTPTAAAGIIARRYSPENTRRVSLESFLMREGISPNTFARLLREISIKGTILGQRVYLNNLFKYSASDLLRLYRYGAVDPYRAKRYHTSDKKGLNLYQYNAKLHAAKILYENIKKLAETEVAR